MLGNLRRNPGPHLVSSQSVNCLPLRLIELVFDFTLWIIELINPFTIKPRIRARGAYFNFSRRHGVANSRWVGAHLFFPKSWFQPVVVPDFELKEKGMSGFVFLALSALHRSGVSSFNFLP